MILQTFGPVALIHNVAGLILLFSEADLAVYRDCAAH